MKNNKRKTVLPIIILIMSMMVGVFIYTKDTNSLSSEPTDEPLNKMQKDVPEQNIMAILELNKYDTEEMLKVGYEIINIIAYETEPLSSWKDAKIFNYEFLHSYYTGKVTHVVFDFLTTDGKNGYVIMNCETHVPDSYGFGKSPYMCFIETKKEDSINKNNYKSYYFYWVMDYGYGIINEDNKVDIYDIRSILVEGNTIIHYNVQFQAEEPVRDPDNFM